MTEPKKISEMTPKEIKAEVQKAYAKVAQRTKRSSSCCGQRSSCANDKTTQKTSLATALGYDVEDIPDSVTESFAGCGNPVALASLCEGEVVLDLGSGAGLDAFLASQKVGETGHVIGIDMTPEMIQKAKNNAKTLGMTNVEFRLGDIEELPVDDESVDVVISNCVINLAPDKGKVFREAFRVLRHGGRMMVSDIVLKAPLPKEVRNEVTFYTGCLGGAILESEYLQLMRDAGFEKVRIVSEAPFNLASSAKIEAFKPKL